MCLIITQGVRGSTAARRYRLFWESYLWYGSRPVEVHHASQQGAGWPHTPTCTCSPTRRPPPWLTFAPKCCNGCLFMLTGAVMGKVQQVAALRHVSGQRGGIITSWASFHSSPPTSVFLSRTPGPAPTVSPLLPAPPGLFTQMYPSHLGSCTVGHVPLNQSPYEPHMLYSVRYIWITTLSLYCTCPSLFWLLCNCNLRSEQYRSGAVSLPVLFWLDLTLLLVFSCIVCSYSLTSSKLSPLGKTWMASEPCEICLLIHRTHGESKVTYIKIQQGATALRRIGVILSLRLYFRLTVPFVNPGDCLPVPNEQDVSDVLKKTSALFRKYYIAVFIVKTVVILL